MLTVTKLLHEKEILHIIGTDFLCLQCLTVLCIFIQIDSQRFDRLIRRYEMVLPLPVVFVIGT